MSCVRTLAFCFASQSMRRLPLATLLFSKLIRIVLYFWLLVLQWIFFETIIALLTLFGVFLDTSSDDIGPTRSKKHRSYATTRSVNLKSIVTVHANNRSYHNMFVLLSKNSHMHTATYATLSIFFTKITS